MFGKKKNPPPHPEHMNMHRPIPEHRVVSRWYIIISILYVIVGIVLFIMPNVTIHSLGIALGIGLIAVGTARIIIYFTRDHFTGIMQMDLTVGVTFAALGTFMLLHKEFVEAMFPFAIAILLLVGAISKLQYAIDLKRLGAHAWKIFLVFAFIMFGLGIVLLYNPFTEKVLVWYIAVSMILEGVLNIIALLWISHRIKMIGQGSFQVVGDSITPDQVFHGTQRMPDPGRTISGPQPMDQIEDRRE